MAPSCLEEISEQQPFKLTFIEEFLRLQGDPDFAAFFTGKNSFAKGVKLGVDMELPRASAVFHEKVAWRQYDAEQSEFLVDGEWRKNYPLRNRMLLWWKSNLKPKRN